MDKKIEDLSEEEKHQTLLEMARDGEPFIAYDPLPLAVVDAAMWDIFIDPLQALGFTLGREETTLGSVVYWVFIGKSENILIAEITLRSMTAEICRIELVPHCDINQDSFAILIGGIMALLDRFRSQLAKEVTRARTLAKEQVTNDSYEIIDDEIIRAVQKIEPARKQAGPPTDPDNDWARGEIAKGRDREEVYEEWLRRRKVQNIGDPGVRQRWRDAFRKALSRRKDGRT